MGLPPAFSSTWFPAHQRATATSIIITSSALGEAVSYVLGPALVSSPPTADDDATSQDDTVTSSPSDISHMRAQILHYMWLQCGLAVTVFLLVLAYFPNRPPNCPTPSARVARMEYKAGAKALLRNGPFWAMCTSYAIISGVYFGWAAFLEPNLAGVLPAHDAQTESGWIGFYGTVVGSFGAVVIGRIVDALQGRMKVLVHPCAAVWGFL